MQGTCIYRAGLTNPWAKGAAALGPRFYRAPIFDFGFFFQPIPYHRKIYILQEKIKIKIIDKNINVLYYKE